MVWRSSKKAIRLSTQSIIKIMIENDFNSAAVPLIGCGASKFNEISEKEIYIIKYKNKTAK